MNTESGSRETTPEVVGAPGGRCRQWGLVWLLVAGVALPAFAAGQTQLGPQTRIDSTNGGPGNETSIASFDFNSMEVVATWNDYRQGSARLGVGLSVNGGQSWSDFLIRPPVGFQATTEGDPMTAFDPRTGTLWVGAISFASNGGVFVARKNAGQTSFQSSVMAEVTGGADKGWMAAGPDPNDPNATRLYIAYNEGLLVSTDLGDTWSGPTSLGLGLGFLPRVGPNGELYIAYWDLSNGVVLRRSFDGGATISGPIHIATRMDVWGVDGSRVPGDYRVAILHHLAVDPNTGTLYCVYFDTTNIVGGNRNLDLYFTKSTNQGSTWTTPVVINTDANPPGDQFFPWIEVDRTGRLHLLFFDTRAVVQDDDDPVGFIEAYYAYSDDGGSTWQEIVLTASPFSSADDGFGGVFLGDYLGLGVGMSRAYPCYLSTHTGLSHIYTRVIVNVLPGDFDQDGDVDLVDSSEFVTCLSGPWQAPGFVLPSQPCRDAFDFNADTDVDLEDFAAFLFAFTG